MTVEKARPYDVTDNKTGWEIVARNMTTNETITGVFDALIVACGREWHPTIPKGTNVQFKNTLVLVHFDLKRSRLDIRVL